MARTDNFQKFVKQKKSGTVKEELRQEKKKEKKARSEAIEAHFEKKRAERMQKQQPVGVAAKAGKFNKYPKNEGPQPDAKTSRPNKFSPKKAEGTAAEKKDHEKASRPNKYPKKEAELPEVKASKPDKFSIKQAKATTLAKKDNEKTSRPDKFPKNETPGAYAITSGPNKLSPRKAEGTVAKKDDSKATADQMPLNKYIAHAGICSRRDAAIMVKEGKVTVNGTTATDPGMKVSENDVVKVSNKKVTPSKNFVYILLNKPKDYITTSEDPQGRKTVLDLVRSATDERVYPVGRLDRNTSGVLLLTNDGELAQKLSHPSNEVKKVYEVKLDRALTKTDIDKIATGITLEDGFIAPDVIAYEDAKDKSVIGIEIHSGRNRIVRRIFEHLKYDVKGLDRVMFAGLTKKDVQRGRWRFLKEKEIRILKFMNQSFVKVKE